MFTKTTALLLSKAVDRTPQVPLWFSGFLLCVEGHRVLSLSHKWVPSTSRFPRNVFRPAGPGAPPEPPLKFSGFPSVSVGGKDTRTNGTPCTLRYVLLLPGRGETWSGFSVHGDPRHQPEQHFKMLGEVCSSHRPMSPWMRPYAPSAEIATHSTFHTEYPAKCHGLLRAADDHFIRKRDF